MLGKSLRVTVALSAAFLAGCGGGGGGGGSDGKAISLAAYQGAGTNIVQVLWNAPDMMRCWATGAWAGEASPTGNVYFEIPVPGRHTFVLTCENFSGRYSASASVNVVAAGFSLTIGANATSVRAGESVRVNWSSEAGGCTASEDWSGAKAASGSESVLISPGFNIFGLSCSGRENWVFVYGHVTTIDLIAEPTTVGADPETTLRWFSWDAGTCTASGAWTGPRNPSGTEGAALAQVDDHEFILTCEGPGPTAEESVVVAAVAPTVRLRTFPRNVSPGETYALEWTTEQAVSCTASGAWSGPRDTAGSVVLTAGPNGSEDYELTCSNPLADTSITDTLTISSPPAFPRATAFHIGSNHAGSTTFPTALQFPGTYAWRRTFSQNVSYAVIADGRAFVTTRHPAAPGMQLFALDLATGDTIWGPIDLAGGNYAGVTYEAGRAFVLNSEGLLSSFDAMTGAPGWTLQFETGNTYMNPPTAMGGIVFVSGRAKLSAVDQATGELLWQRSGDGGSPSVTPTAVYVSDQCQTYAYSPVYGRLLWRLEECLGVAGSGTVVVAGGRIYVPDYVVGSPGIRAIRDAATGALITSIPSETVPAVTSSQIFTISDTVYAYSLSGELQWSFDNDGLPIDLRAAPIAINDRVIISHQNDVRALNAATGELVWTADAGGYLGNTEGDFPWSGLMAGEGYLIAPGSNVLTAWKIVP